MALSSSESTAGSQYWATLLDPLHDQLCARPDGDGSWRDAEKSMSKLPALRRSLQVGKSTCTSSTRTPTWRSCCWISSDIEPPDGAGVGHQAVEARAACPSRSRTPSPSWSTQPRDSSRRRSGRAVLRRPAPARRAGSRAARRPGRRAPSPYSPSTAFTMRRRSSASVIARRTSSVGQDRMRPGRIFGIPLVVEQVAQRWRRNRDEPELRSGRDPGCVGDAARTGCPWRRPRRSAPC